MFDAKSAPILFTVIWIGQQISSMRKPSSLGCESNLFNKVSWFSCGAQRDGNNYPFYIQDTTHIATKLRNHFLKTIKSPKLFPLDEKFFIQQAHLQFLVDKFSKDKHNLTATILNPIDKQNFDSVLRMCDQKVIDLLRNSVAGSQGTTYYDFRNHSSNYTIIFKNRFDTNGARKQNLVCCFYD